MNFYPQIDNRLFYLSKPGLLKVSGPDVRKFLQGQLTTDMDALNSGNGVLSAHCNPQGRIISLFYLFNVNNDYFLAMPHDLLSIAQKALQKYAAFYKAIIEDASHTLTLVGTRDIPAPDTALAAYAFPDQNRLLCLQPALPASEHTSDAEWQAMNIQAGIPEITAATSGLFLPHDINLPDLHAVCFTKGCFTGQEIIARMHYRGKPKNHLYHGFVKQPEQPGTLLYAEGQPAGTIINCSTICFQDYYALLFVASESVVAQQTLQTEHEQIIELQKSE